MSTPTYDAGRLALMLNELRLPTIGRLWSEFAQRSDKEGWQATRLLGALFEHERQCNFSSVKTCALDFFG